MYGRELKTGIAIAAVALCILAVACQGQGGNQWAGLTEADDTGAIDAGADVENLSSDDYGQGADSTTGTVVDPDTGEVLVDPDTGNAVTTPKGTLLPEGGGSPNVPIAGYEAKEDGREYYRGRIRVEFGADAPEETMRSVVSELGYEWGSGHVFHDGTASVTVVVDKGCEDEAVERFNARPEVALAWREYRSGLSLNDDLDAPADPIDDDDLVIAAETWQQYHLYAARFQKAWTKVKCNGAATVAVLDTGKPKPALSDLETNIDYDRAYDAVFGYVNWGTDAHGHGTAVAGLISGIAGNGFGVDGASYNAEILPVRVGISDRDDPETEDVDEGLTWERVARGLDYLLSLDDAPDVVNMSLGGPEETGNPDFQRVQGQVDELRERGVVVVAAAGNSAGAQSYPALLDGVVSVGALAQPAGGVSSIVQDGGYSGASAWGSSSTASDVDLCAFGENVWVLWPLPADLPVLR